MNPEGKSTPFKERSLRLLSPAKVNLFLRVLSKRADGYHEIYSLMQPVALFDEITISVGSPGAAGIRLDCDNPALPADKNNLAWRAAELFLGKTGFSDWVSVEIGIAKKIPAGAGLGGGSSNAATVLMGLNTALNAGLSDIDLMEMGAGIGSDVPFFMMRGAALARGRGELLEKVALPNYHYILINPGFSVSTAWAYGSLDLTKRAENNILSVSKESFGDIAVLKGCLVNDLEDVTAGNYPQISALKRLLLENGAAGALMSGSGPTVFGIFEDGARAARAYEALSRGPCKDKLIFSAQGL